MNKPRKQEYALERNYERVGKHLREMRKKAGLTQRQVSDALGYSSSQFISNFECGIAVPPLRKLKTMVDLYNMDVSELLDIILREDRKVMLKTLSQRRRA
ncbi:MAG: helix-turn-helix domain-containing protein [Bdellovibrionota bacterium]